eukprot:3863124-Pyramimonas_sp.AAC.1
MTLPSTKHTNSPPPAVNDVDHMSAKCWCFSVNYQGGAKRLVAPIQELSKMPSSPTAANTTTPT